MKKILIISYNALPFDMVSSYRAKAYCDFFFEFDIYPTLITNRWEKNADGEWKFHDDNTFIEEEHEKYKIFRLPHPKYSRLDGSLRSKIQTMQCLLRGNLDVELVSSYQTYKKFLFSHLQEHTYDLVLSVFNPHYHLKLAYEIKIEFNIPYVLDFRDLWDNEVVTKSYRPSSKKKLLDKIYKFWWKKWLNDALFFTITSDKWREYLSRLSRKEGFVIRNGFDRIVKSNRDKETKKFSVVHFGRIYKNQDIYCFLEGFRKFSLLNHVTDIEFRLIGLKSESNFNALKVIKKFVRPEFLATIPYLPKEDLISYCQRNATVFWLPNFKEDNGQFMVKLYDYISIKRPVIICPANGSDLENILRYTNSGETVSTADDVFRYLKKAYQEFKDSGCVKFDGDDSRIAEFERINQVRALAGLIHKNLN